MEKQSPHPLLYLSGLKKTTHLLSPSLLSLSLLLSPPENSMAHSIGSLTVNTNKSPTTRKLYLLHHPARFSQKTNNNIPLMTTKYSRTVFVLMMATDGCCIAGYLLGCSERGLKTNGKAGSGANVSTNRVCIIYFRWLSLPTCGLVTYRLWGRCFHQQNLTRPTAGLSSF